MKSIFRRLVGWATIGLLLVASTVPAYAQSQSGNSSNGSNGAPPLGVWLDFSSQAEEEADAGSDTKRLVAHVSEVNAQGNYLLIHQGSNRTKVTTNHALILVVSSQSVRVGTLADLTVGANARFLVKKDKAADGSYEALLIMQAQLNQDTTPNVQFDYTTSTQAEGTASFDIPLSLSRSSTQNVNVHYTVSGSASGNGTDFTLADGDLSFAAGQTKGKISLSVTEDNLDELDETVVVTLSNPSNATLGANAQFTYTITDNDTSSATLEFENESGSGSESTSSATAAVVLSNVLAHDVKVSYKVTGDASCCGIDYRMGWGMVTIPAGQTRSELSMKVMDDSVHESDETVVISLVNPVDVTLGVKRTFTYTIQDNDAAPTGSVAMPTIGFESEAASALESAGNYTLPVVLSQASPLEVKVNYKAVGTASCCGVDYRMGWGTATIRPGETRANLNLLQIFDDSTMEPDEGIVVTLFSPSNAALNGMSVFTYTIMDDDWPVVAFESGSASGGEETVDVNIPVTLSKASPLETKIDYKVSGSAKCCGEDYRLGWGTLTFRAGETRAILGMTVSEDLLNEVDETVVVSLSNPSNAKLGEQSVFTYTIQDNDEGAPVPPATPTVEFENEFGQGTEGTSPVTIGVKLSGAAAEDVRVVYKINGTASCCGEDYLLGWGTLVIPAGQTSAQLSLMLSDDSLDEQDETVIVRLYNPEHADLGAKSVFTFTIQDNDEKTPPPPPGRATIEFKTDAASVNEGDTPVLMNVYLSAAASEEVRVGYKVTGTAKCCGEDYRLGWGTLKFAAGETSKQLSLVLTDDTIDEPNETVIVTLQNAENADLGATSVLTFTIQDNDEDVAPPPPPTGTPSVEFQADSASGTEATSPVTITANLSHASADVVQVPFKVHGTAKCCGEDYRLGWGTLVFQPGETSKALKMHVQDDGLDEEDENVVVALSNPSNATLGAKSIFTYTIQDNDEGAVPEVTVQFGRSADGTGEAGGSVEIPVTLSEATDHDVGVFFYVTSGTATQGDDYLVSEGALTIPAGQTSGSVLFTILNDDMDEANETVTLTLSNPEGAKLGTYASHTHTIVDND